MKALLVAAGAGLAMGLLAGAALQAPTPAEAAPAESFQNAAFAEDPGVSLHRLAMGSESWEAPTPYIRVTYPSPDYETEAPPLADVTLADLTLADLEPADLQTPTPPKPAVVAEAPIGGVADVVAASAEAVRPLQIAAAPQFLALDTAVAPR
jgi:hypothetical protein